MTGQNSGGTHSEITGGSQYGPVLQGRDFGDIDIDVTVRPPPRHRWRWRSSPALTSAFTGRDEELGILAGLLGPDCWAAAGSPLIRPSQGRGGGKIGRLPANVLIRASANLRP